MPPRFGHVVLRTNRRAALETWYGEVLGARVVDRQGAISFLTYDDDHHRIALFDPGPLGPAREDVPGVAHVAFALGSLAELHATRARLADRQITAARSVGHAWTLSLYYRDPDGNWVELYVDRTPGDPAVP